jgi:hypothetical protein
MGGKSTLRAGAKPRAISRSAASKVGKSFQYAVSSTKDKPRA